MRESNAFIEAGAAEAFAPNQTLENILTGDLGSGSHEQFTEDFQAMFLAARMRVTQDCIGFDDFFEQHRELAVRYVMAAAADLLYRQKSGLDETSLLCVSCVMVGKFFL
jgi:hypothetical protein